MKMYYTVDELRNISKDELIELTTFGPNNEYFYSELTSLLKEENEYSFIFKNGETIFTQSEDTYNNAKIGKMRYNLITQSSENVQKETKIREQFLKDTQDFVVSQINIFNTEMTKQSSVIVDNNKSYLDNLKKETFNTIKNIEDTNNNLKQINIKDFEDKMKKLDKIIDTFGELLKD